MNVSRELRANRGFTLVEVLIALGLSTIVLGLVFSIYIGQQRNFLVGNSYINIHQDARMAMDWMAKDIRWGIELLPSHGAYSTSNSCVVLKIPSIDSAGDVIDIDNDHDYLIYKLNTSDPSKLERTIDAKDGVSSRADETRTVAENISSLTFSYNGTGLSSVADLSTVTDIETALTTFTTVPPVSLSDRLNTTVMLRNKEKE